MKNVQMKSYPHLEKYIQENSPYIKLSIFYTVDKEEQECVVNMYRSIPGSSTGELLVQIREVNMDLALQELDKSTLMVKKAQERGKGKSYG